MPRYFLAMILAFSCGTAAAEDSLPKELPPAQEAIALRMAEAAGLRIYRHDRAATVATDAALAIPALKADKRVNGWITGEQEGQLL